MTELGLISRCGSGGTETVEFGTSDRSDYIQVLYCGGERNCGYHAIVNYIRTSERRRGNGRKLLQFAYADAINRGVQTVYAEIASEDGLEFCRHLVGDEFVQVASTGDPNCPDTRAFLRVPLDQVEVSQVLAFDAE